MLFDGYYLKSLEIVWPPEYRHFREPTYRLTFLVNKWVIIVPDRGVLESDLYRFAAEVPENGDTWVRNVEENTIFKKNRKI